MTRNRTGWTRLAQGSSALLLAVLCLGAVESVRATTTLYLDGAGIADGSPIPQTYGSQASADGDGIGVSMGNYAIGTPTTSLVWVNERFLFRSDWQGRGSVAQFAPPVGSDPYSSNTFLIVFIADAHFTLNSFDLDLQSGGSPVELDWNVGCPLDGALAFGNWQRATDGRDTIHPTFSLDLDVGTDYFLTLTVKSGDISSIGIDNLTFDAVPEPSALALAALGGLGFRAAARRRRQTQKEEQLLLGS